MNIPTEISAYILALSIPIAGATGARLDNTKDVSRISKIAPLPILLFTLVYGTVGVAAVFYFSWAYLEWQHIVAFFIVQFTVASKIADQDTRAAVWVGFVFAVLLATGAEIYLLFFSAST